jgi:nitrate/nitrite transporter NarK
MLHSSLKAIGSLQAPLEGWMNDRHNVIRFLLARFLLMTLMVLAFASLYLTRQ